MLLSGILFLTAVWGYSALDGRARPRARAPTMAAVFAVPAGRLGRIGASAQSPPPALCFRGRLRLIYWQIGPTPDYASEFLPGWLLAGAGVGLVLSTLAAAARRPSARALRHRHGRFGMARQLGTAIGIAILVAAAQRDDRRRPARWLASRLVVFPDRGPRNRDDRPRPQVGERHERAARGEARHATRPSLRAKSPWKKIRSTGRRSGGHRPGTKDLGVMAGQNGVPGVLERLETFGGAALRGVVVPVDREAMVIEAALEVGDVGADYEVAHLNGLVPGGARE